MKPTVLIVDDSLTVRMDLGEAFEDAGFGTTLCATLTAARDALARYSFSVIVLDILLPDGDGIEFLKEVRGSIAASIPVMLLSSEAEVRDRLRGLKTGAQEYVGKPYNTAFVVERARELAAGRSGADAHSTTHNSVLIIDDSETARQSMATVLQGAGFDVLLAVSGEDGLRVAAAQRPLAVVVDGILPGIDGAEVIRRLRMDPALRRTPCLLLTGSIDAVGEVSALDSGADAYIRKGEDFDVILARLNALLRSSQENLPAAHERSGLRPKRVLAVDDSATYLNELSSQLRQDGYDVVQAQSGQEALELLAVQPVDCILLDLVMPGLSGDQTCSRIKSTPAWRDIPLMILTGMEENQAMIASINAGADDYITKSADFEVLRARLRAQMRRRQFEDENRNIREQLLQKELEAMESRASRELAETRAILLEDLRQKNEELEAFSYSVSHDLRAPLRAIDGFSQALLEDYTDRLDEEGRHYLKRVRDATQRMATLIDDLLTMSRFTRQEMHVSRVNLTAMAQGIVNDLRQAQPQHPVEFVLGENLSAQGDVALLRVALENLLNNAWKYTGYQSHPRVEFGGLQKDGQDVFFVRDNGAGFDMQYARKLFTPFQRMHTDKEFTGTGIGLATVSRIIRRHGGTLWAEAAPGQGATFYFQLPPRPNKEPEDTDTHGYLRRTVSPHP